MGDNTQSAEICNNADGIIQNYQLIVNNGIIKN